jgi:hypothetical protein
MTDSKIIDASGVDETIFEPGDDARLAGPLAVLAWFALAFLTGSASGAMQNGLIYKVEMAVSFVLVGGVIALAVLTQSRFALSRRVLKLTPWLLIVAVGIDAWLVVGYLAHAAN